MGRRIKNFQNILKQLERAADSEETKSEAWGSRSENENDREVLS